MLADVVTPAKRSDKRMCGKDGLLPIPMVSSRSVLSLKPSILVLTYAVRGRRLDGKDEGTEHRGL